MTLENTNITIIHLKVCGRLRLSPSIELIAGGKMNLPTRTLLLVTGLLALAVLAIASTPDWTARQVWAREQSLRQKVEALRIEVDAAKTQRQVAEITESEYFQQLQQRVRNLRASGQNPEQGGALD